MSRLYQIHEADLEVLERELPELMHYDFVGCNNPVVRKQWETVKTILSNVRWNYGPPTEVKKLEEEK